MKQEDLAEGVLASIRSGKVGMRPRSHFVLMSGLYVLGGLLVLLALVFFASFFLFALRQSGALFLPGFGGRGWIGFLSAMPWAILLIAAFFLMLLEVFVRRHPIAYKKPIAYSVILIALVAMAGGYVFAQTGAHRMMYMKSLDRRLPVGGGMYRMYGAPRLERVFPGVVTSLPGEPLAIETVSGERYLVEILGETRAPLGATFEEGDRIIVMGAAASGTIRAFGIRPVPEEGSFIMRHGPGGPRLRLMQGSGTPPLPPGSEISPYPSP